MRLRIKTAQANTINSVSLLLRLGWNLFLYSGVEVEGLRGSSNSTLKLFSAKWTCDRDFMFYAGHTINSILKF